MAGHTPCTPTPQGAAGAGEAFGKKCTSRQNVTLSTVSHSTHSRVLFVLLPLLSSSTHSLVLEPFFTLDETTDRHPLTSVICLQRVKVTTDIHSWNFPADDSAPVRVLILQFR